MKYLAERLIATGVLMLLLCTGFVIYNSTLETNAARQVQNTTQRLLDGIGEASALPLPLHEPELASDDSYFFEGREYLGVLSIPDLGRQLPVLVQCSDENLQHAPCRYSGGINAGGLVIAAHNFSSHFGGIAELELGSVLSFTDANNIERQYKLELIETLEPEDVDAMCDTDWDLSLFTCTYGGAGRVTARWMLLE